MCCMMMMVVVVVFTFRLQLVIHPLNHLTPKVEAWTSMDKDLGDKDIKVCLLKPHYRADPTSLPRLCAQEV